MSKSKPRTYSDMEKERMDEQTARLREVATEQNNPANRRLLDAMWERQMGREPRREEVEDTPPAKEEWFDR